MRMPSWKALVRGLLCAVLCGSVGNMPSSAAAQERGQLSPTPYQAPAAGVGAPVFDGAPNAGGGFYGAPEAPPPGAWPANSPFNANDYERLENNGGIWEYETRPLGSHSKKKTKIGIDYIMGWGLKPGPDVLIGDANAYLHAYPADDTFPVPPFDRVTPLDYGDPQPFREWPARRTNMFDDMDHYGVRITLGAEFDDGWEWQASGFALLAREASFTFNGETPDPTDIDPYVFRLPIADGTQNGNVISFDGQLIVEYDQKYYGTDIEFFSSPFFKTEGFSLRANLSAKYLFVEERFGFLATDSAVEYQYTGDDGTITLVVPPVNLPNGIPAFTSGIKSKVTSNLVGPLLGVRADLGGDAFKVIGSLKAGALVNMETTNLDYKNIRPQINQDALLQQGPTGHKSDETTYITPVFQTGISGEFGFLGYLPVLRSIPLVNTAKFRVGYDYTLIGSMQRPAQAIDYIIDHPDIKSKRQNNSIKTVNFGLDWSF